MRALPAVLATLTAFSFSSAVWASPRNVHVSWNTPDTSSTVAVTWMSDSTGDPSLVQYGTSAPGQFELEGTVFQGNDDLGAIHVVEISKLEPGTTYQYRAGGPGDWSDIHKFTTGPEGECAAFRFAAFGDNRPDTDWVPQFHWNPILAETAETNPAFLLHTGDIVMDGNATNQWNMFFETSHPYVAYLPLMAAIGNHDDGPGSGDQSNYNQVFTYPRNENSGTEDYYYFTYGNAIFVSISTQTEEGGSPPFSVQADWLDKVLTDNPRRWKFVFLHHPPYTSHLKFDLIFTEFEFNHPPNENDQNEALVPVFDEHHVDIVFAGHNHYYERLGPMVQGPNPEEGTPVASFLDGTVYVITGGAGAFVYDEFDVMGVELDLVSWVCGKAAGSETCAGDHHYTTVDIDDNVMHYEAWSTMEQMTGSNPANKKLLDSFTVTKDPTLECQEVEQPEPGPEPELDVVEQESEVVTVEEEPETSSPESAEDAGGQ